MKNPVQPSVSDTQPEAEEPSVRGSAAREESSAYCVAVKRLLHSLLK